MFQIFNLAEFRREMSDFLPVGICILDRQLTIHHWNQRLVEWTGHSSHEMFGQILLDCFPHLTQPHFLQRMEDSFRSGCPVTFSAAIHRNVIPAKSSYGTDGVMFQDALLLPLHDHPDHGLLVIMDVTRRVQESNALRQERQKLKRLSQDLQRQTEALKLAEEQALAASRAKSDFLANVSHEIRTPMTAILGFADVLNDFEVSSDERANAIGTIRSNGEHLLQLINDILDVSKIEVGRLEMELASCCLPELIKDINTIFSARAHQRGIGFEIKIAPLTPTYFETDTLRLKQVLINLLTNAMKFTDLGMVQLNISLSMANANQPVMQFEVVDSGIGMTTDQIDGLFQAFVQVDTSASRRFSGTGLGLVICKRICELLGGGIQVTSRANVGSRFLVNLPVDLAQLGSQPAPINRLPVDQLPVETSRGALPLSGLKILLAEDGLDNQKLIGFRLRKEGANFKMVGDGQAAIDMVHQAAAFAEPFDIVLMDMQMPEVDGYQAARQLRAEGCTLPIIALTAHAMSHDRQVCLDAGCTDYHTKPIDWPKLRDLIINHAHAGQLLVN